MHGSGLNVLTALTQSMSITYPHRDLDLMRASSDLLPHFLLKCNPEYLTKVTNLTEENGDLRR